MKYLIIHQDDSNGEICQDDMEVVDFKGDSFADYMEDHWNRGETPPIYIPLSMVEKALKKKVRVHE